MTGARVVLRAAAERDLPMAADRYRAERGAAEAERFAEAVEAALRHISGHPKSGSPRHGRQLGIPGLRSWPLPAPYPYLVFYREASARIDVGRILHNRRDIPASLQERDMRG